jgi:hypothetical protein
VTTVIIRAALFSVILLPHISSPVAKPAQTNNEKRVMTWSGEIMDTQCATEGSHDAMMAKNHAKNAQECALICAKNGSFVLFDSGSSTVYQFDDQEKPMRFAGQRVRVTGTYDEPSKTITIQSIQTAPKIPPKDAQQ